MKTLLRYEYLSDEQWNEIAKENDYDINDDAKRTEIDCEYFEDELEYVNTLLSNIDEKENIVIIGDLGLWNGRVAGYKVISNDARDILTSIGYDNYPIIKLNDKNELYGEVSHHDGINYYRFRVWRTGFSDSQKDKFLNLIYNQEVEEKDIVKYTKALRVPKKIFA